MSDMKTKYTVQKAGAKRRGIPFALSFDDWRDIWLDSGKWTQRGVGVNKYCMCRVGDKGGYEKGNVFIGLFNANASDANAGRVQSDSKRIKLSLAAKGRKQSAEWIAKRAQALKDRKVGV